MDKKGFKHIILFLFLFLFSDIYAVDNSDIYIDLVPSIGLNPCGYANADELVHIVAKTNLTNIQISFQLPIGIDYVLGTVTNGVTELNVSNLNAPVFSVGNLLAFQVKDFNFTRTANCSAVQHEISGGIFKDEFILSYSGGTSSPLIDINPNIYTYNLDYASLVLPPINSLTVNVGDHITNRNVTVNQGGDGCVEEFVH